MGTVGGGGALFARAICVVLVSLHFTLRGCEFDLRCFIAAAGPAVAII